MLRFAPLSLFAPSRMSAPSPDRDTISICFVHEALVAIRALPGGDKPIIIFCTTENEMSQIMKAMSAGANKYVMKPFDADIVKDKFIQTGLLEG